MKSELIQNLRNEMKKVAGEIHTAFPGTITAYDPASNTAEVLPGIQLKKPDGTKMDYPKISGVPVVCFRAGGATIALPIKAGDGCLIVVSEKAIDKWMYGQETDTDLNHDITNAMCIPGLFASGNSAQQTACSSGKVVIDSGGAGVSINGDISISGSISCSGSVHGTNI